MDQFCKILIVDDEFIMRQGIKHILDWEKEGFQIIGQASNGQEAIEFIKKNPPHIVISDIMMPQINGIELAKFIQTHYPQIQIIILSSYSDFEYVKSSFQYGAVDYILKPSLNPKELLQTLKKSLSKISNLTLLSNNITHTKNILNRVILGFGSDIDFEHLNNLFVYPYFCIFGINVKKIYSNYDKRNQMIDFIISKMNDEFSSDCETQNNLSEVVNIENEVIILVINFNSKDYENILDRLINFSNLVYSELSETFFVLSKIFNSISDIKNIYEKDFLILTQQYFYNKNKHYLFSNDLKSGKQMVKFNFKRFSELVSLMQIPNSLEMLKKYVVEAISDRSLTEFELKSLIQNCFYNIIANLESLNFDSSSLNALKYDSFNKIDDTKYSDDLIETFDFLLNNFNELISKYEHKINSHMINKIIQYINEHYSDQLTLSDVSNLFNFNYYYLSSYFSSHNAEGFNEFLNKIRIEKACNLLKQDIPISSISSMVGYSDHSYFCKVFKKFIGVTPSNFRKNNIKISI